MVVYAGSAGLVLPPTSGEHQDEILAALDRLEAGGSTNGGDGIRLAYAMAKQAFVKDGVNRVILATDGDFNVGIVDQKELVQLIEHERESGVFLSVLGFGRGNLNDAMMEAISNHGNGNHRQPLGETRSREDHRAQGRNIAPEILSRQMAAFSKQPSRRSNRPGSGCARKRR